MSISTGMLSVLLSVFHALLFRVTYQNHVNEISAFNRQQKEKKPDDGQDYQASLEELDILIESVQDFWRYNNNTPVDQIKMRESIYLFKKGFKPIWEDRRNLLGGSWTFRVGKNIGPDFWTRVQLMAIGEQLQAALDEGMYLPLHTLFCRTIYPSPTQEVYST